MQRIFDNDIGRLVKELPVVLAKAGPSNYYSIGVAINNLFGPEFEKAFPDFDLGTLVKEEVADDVKDAAEWWKKNGPTWSRRDVIKDWVKLEQAGSLRARFRSCSALKYLTQARPCPYASELKGAVLDKIAQRRDGLSALRVELAQRMARGGDPEGVAYMIDVLSHAPPPLV